MLTIKRPYSVHLVDNRPGARKPMMFLDTFELISTGRVESRSVFDVQLPTRSLEVRAAIEQVLQSEAGRPYFRAHSSAADLDRIECVDCIECCVCHVSYTRHAYRRHRCGGAR